AQVLALVVGGHTFSLFNIFLISSFLLLLFEQKVKYSRNKNDIYFLIWMALSILSSLFGVIYFLEYYDFLTTSISFIPKILIFLVFYLLLSRRKNNSEYCVSLLSGIKYGILFNLIWSIFDTSIYYISGFSITNTFFHLILMRII
ncbi:MAG: hypothetical protein LRY59_00585, partial [Bacteroides graminisolvens]|nr:hypothetical protein [Bacteroides graminisolvens]